MKSLLLRAIICLFPILSFSQITGKITDTKGEPLPFVNIYAEDDSYGSTSNEDGLYELKPYQAGNYTLVFQFLGYKTVKKEVNYQNNPITVNVSLEASSTSLDEILVDAGENPANAIIQKAIKNRKKNADKLQSFTADFYSRGLWRMKDVPKKILGREIGDLGGSLDSTGSGIVYLSETISKISYQKPDDFKEEIIASKVSGDDNGFSLNSAQEAYFSFYENTLEINSDLVSPIAEYAFNYYNYKLEGVFYDDWGNLINKIRVSPKRENDRIFKGHIYIVEDLWQIYAVELTATGKAIQVPPIEELVFKQSYKYSEQNKLYIQISQSVDFSFKIFGFGGNGRFTAVYSKYNFIPEFTEKTFGREILSYAENANKKDSVYWEKVRPVPLTNEEMTDYVRKDSIQDVRNSRVYMDSVDTEKNKFGITDLLFGYSYQDSWNNRNFSISAPVAGIRFNTVQGWNGKLDINYIQRDTANNSNYWRAFADLNYGIAEDRLRASGGFQKKFNNITKPILRIEGGSAINQINNTEPISSLLNSVITIFFERNYLKLYDLDYFRIGFQKDFFPGVRLYANAGYEDRSPVFNNTDHVFIDWDERNYTSNNPFQPANFNSVPFESHNLIKTSLGAQIKFGQKYISFPNGRFNVDDTKYPELSLTWEKGFAANDSRYNFDEFKAGIKQDVKLGNKGRFSYQLNGGIFSNAEGISLVDYQHFNGNQTRLGVGSYIGKFNLMPYYDFSTNQNFAEFHAEHDFQGWILGKLPLINKLNFNLIAGAHRLMTDGRNPYSEYSLGIDNIGIGKFRFLRLDYVVSDFNGNRDGAFVFGLKFIQ